MVTGKDVWLKITRFHKNVKPSDRALKTWPFFRYMFSNFPRFEADSQTDKHFEGLPLLSIQHLLLEKWTNSPIFSSWGFEGAPTNQHREAGWKWFCQWQLYHVWHKPTLWHDSANIRVHVLCSFNKSNTLENTRNDKEETQIDETQGFLKSRWQIKY